MTLLTLVTGSISLRVVRTHLVERVLAALHQYRTDPQASLELLKCVRAFAAMHGTMLLRHLSLSHASVLQTICSMQWSVLEAFLF